jgi:hypothetical protein
MRGCWEQRVAAGAPLTTPGAPRPQRSGDARTPLAFVPVGSDADLAIGRRAPARRHDAGEPSLGPVLVDPPDRAGLWSDLDP